MKKKFSQETNKPHEQIVCIRRPATDTEKLNQVVKLPVDIAAHCDRTADALDICFMLQNFACFFTKLSDLRLSQMLAIAQFLDPAIDLMIRSFFLLKIVRHFMAHVCGQEIVIETSSLKTTFTIKRTQICPSSIRINSQLGFRVNFQTVAGETPL